MGLQIKQNQDGLFNLVSSISDDQLHDEQYITQEQAALILIDRLQLDYMAKVIEVAMTFPSGYMVNGKYSQQNYNSAYHNWYGVVLKQDNWIKLIKERYNQIPNIQKFI